MEDLRGLGLVKEKDNDHKVAIAHASFIGQSFDRFACRVIPHNGRLTKAIAPAPELLLRR